ncbi:MAG: MotE family protein [Desulfovibrionaceae bacterium]|nr:MotE family protein [Desulfovibrionaceae bacterium]
MKSRPLGTRLKLSRIFRCFGVVAGIKLAVLAALLFDLPGKMADVGLMAVNEPVQEEVGTSIPVSSGVAHAAGLLGDGADNATSPDENKCQDSVDPMLREALDRRQVELERREQDLRVLEGQLNEKLEDMQALEGRIQMMLKDAQDLQDKKLKHLVDVYSNMKAKQAGQVLETLDERTAVRILAGMRGRQAGEILNNITPEKAARLSEMLTRMQLPFN